MPRANRGRCGGCQGPMGGGVEVAKGQWGEVWRLPRAKATSTPPPIGPWQPPHLPLLARGNLHTSPHWPLVTSTPPPIGPWQPPHLPPLALSNLHTSPHWPLATSTPPPIGPWQSPHLFLVALGNLHTSSHWPFGGRCGGCQGPMRGGVEVAKGQ